MKKKIKKICSKNIVLAKCFSLFLLVRDKHKKANNYIESKEFIEKKGLKKNTIKDVYFSMIYNKISHTEYFLYNFYKLNKTGRKEYIGKNERHEILDSFENKNSRYFMKDKYATYEKFKKYYKRDIVMIKDREDHDLYESFYKKHKNFIAKPYNSNSGQGVLKISKDYEKYWNEYISNGDYVLEEYIIESDELLSFHPNSVNTVRFATFNKNKKIYNGFAFLRIGQGESVVDNLGAGGISAAIDLETGIITSTGKDEKLNEYIIHPDTKKQIIGFKIPKWNELLKIVNEVAEMIPDYPYISWDFALTSKGWVLIEANGCGVFDGIQMHEIGLRDKVDFFLNKD